MNGSAQSWDGKMDPESNWLIIMISVSSEISFSVNFIYKITQRCLLSVYLYNQIREQNCMSSWQTALPLPSSSPSLHLHLDHSICTQKSLYEYTEDGVTWIHNYRGVTFIERQITAPLPSSPPRLSWGPSQLTDHY